MWRGIYKVSNWFHRKNLNLFGKVFRMLNIMVNGCDIGGQAKLNGVSIWHTVGVVIGGGAEIGEGTIIMSGVVVGGGGRWSSDGKHIRSETGPGSGEGHPRIGKNVFIGANAVILGSIVVGDGAVIGANAVVTKDVPPGAKVVGSNKIINIGSLESKLG